MHKFDDDFYGSHMRVVALGYMRPEKNFSGLEDLIAAIHEDIRQADALLDTAPFAAFKTHEFFSSSNEQ